MTAAAATPAIGIRWKQAQRPHHCAECACEIFVGDTIAIYDEACGVGLSFPPFHRIYCELCGHLLEDSLTTTEML
jgi:hypothetical protein